MRILLSIVLLCNFLGVNAQKATSFQTADLKIDWQLVTNNYQEKEQYLFTIKLTNTSKKMLLPAGGWTIYYNANRDVIKHPVEQPLETFRIHGDLFYLKPTAQFKGLKPGESIQIEGIGGAWAFNISDAPSGYYLVWDKAPQKAHAITNITATPPADINKFKRSPDQVNDQVTPEMVFEQNKDIKAIAEENLPRVFPTPVSLKQGEGFFTINSETPFSLILCSVRKLLTWLLSWAVSLAKHFPFLRKEKST